MFMTAKLSLPCDVPKLHGNGFAVRRFLCRALTAFAVWAAFAVRHASLPCGQPLLCAISKYTRQSLILELKKNYYPVCRCAPDHRRSARPPSASLRVTTPRRRRVQVAAH
jgi:hypothetical protein